MLQGVRASLPIPSTFPFPDVVEWQERQDRLRASLLEQAKKGVDQAVKVMEREEMLGHAEASTSKSRRAVVLYLDKGDSGRRPKFDLVPFLASSRGQEAEDAGGKITRSNPVINHHPQDFSSCCGG